MEGKEAKLKPVLLLTVIAVALGTNFGIYNSSVVNNLELHVTDYINRTGYGTWISKDTSTVMAVFISTFTASTGIGNLFAPFLGELLGRKYGLIISGLCNVIGSALCFFYLHLFELSLVGRFFQGLALGIGRPLASAFVTEITPIKYRGKFNPIQQSAFAFGVLCGMLFATYPILGRIERSNLCLAVTLIPAAIQIVALILGYDTPRYLVLKRKDSKKGLKALEYYQGKLGANEAMNEILSEKGVSENRKHNEKSKCSKICSSEFRKPLILANLIHVTLALSGPTLIMCFSTKALNSNKLPSHTELCTVILGICNLAGSFFPIFLMEKFGRKKLFIVGLLGCFGSLVLYTIFSCFINYTNATANLGYGMVVSLGFYFLFLSVFTASSVTLTAEICSQPIRSIAISSANFSLMAVSTIMICLYSPMANGLGQPWVFIPWSILSVIMGTYLIYNIPETTGKSLSEIKYHFVKSQGTE